MKTHTTSLMHWASLARTVAAAAVLNMTGQVLAQTPPPAPAIGGAAYPAVAASAPGGAKHARREVIRAPVKPQHYPSNPQPPVPTRR